MTTEYKPARDRLEGCWRCGSHDTPWAQLLRLFGNYHANLCRECLNNHAQWLFALPEFRTFQDCEIEEAQLYRQITYDGRDRASAIRDVADRMMAINNSVFKLTEVWVNERIERPEAVKIQPAPEMTRDEKIAKWKRQIARAERELALLENPPEEPKPTE